MSRPKGTAQGNGAAIGRSGDRVLRVSLDGGAARVDSTPCAVPLAGTYVLGDPQDAEPGREGFLGHGVTCHVDADGSTRIRTSLSGLPPVFAYQDGQHIAAVWFRERDDARRRSGDSRRGRSRGWRAAAARALVRGDLMRERRIAEFVHDTLRSRRASVLDRHALDRGFDARSARSALMFALDVTLAQESFRVA